MTAEVVACSGATGVARVQVRYGEPVVQEYLDLWVVTVRGRRPGRPVRGVAVLADARPGAGADRAGGAGPRRRAGRSVGRVGALAVTERRGVPDRCGWRGRPVAAPRGRGLRGDGRCGRAGGRGPPDAGGAGHGGVRPAPGGPPVRRHHRGPRGGSGVRAAGVRRLGSRRTRWLAGRRRSGRCSGCGPGPRCCRSPARLAILPLDAERPARRRRSWPGSRRPGRRCRGSGPARSGRLGWSRPPTRPRCAPSSCLALELPVGRAAAGAGALDLPVVVTGVGGGSEGDEQGQSESCGGEGLAHDVLRSSSACCDATTLPAGPVGGNTVSRTLGGGTASFIGPARQA